MAANFWKYLTQDNYSSDEQLKGVKILLILVLLVIASPLVYHFFVPNTNPIQSATETSRLQLVYAQKLDSLNRFSGKNKDYGHYKEYSSAYSNDYKSSYHSNEYARFNHENYDDKSENATQQIAQNTSQKIHTFNLNSATKEDLTSVNGIGDVFADRILKYRESLGGFYTVNQLYEVFKIDSGAVDNCKKHLVGELKPYKLLKINKEEFKPILYHPYLEFEEVKTIFKNRPIASQESFCRILPKRCSQVSPYLDYEN
jgi:competence ComEA-like helix-hairpin-helix protein